MSKKKALRPFMYQVRALGSVEVHKSLHKSLESSIAGRLA